MKPLSLVAVLFLVAAVPPQDPPGYQGRGDDTPGVPRKVPRASESSCCEEGRAKPWPRYNQGVRWIQPLVAAAKKARESQKLLLVFHLVGDLDREGC